MADNSDLKGAIAQVADELGTGAVLADCLPPDRNTLKGALARLEWVRDRAFGGNAATPNATSFTRAAVLARAHDKLFAIVGMQYVSEPVPDKRYRHLRLLAAGLSNARLARLCLDLERVCRLLGLD